METQRVPTAAERSPPVTTSTTSGTAAAAAGAVLVDNSQSWKPAGEKNNSQAGEWFLKIQKRRGNLFLVWHPIKCFPDSEDCRPGWKGCNVFTCCMQSFALPKTIWELANIFFPWSSVYLQLWYKVLWVQWEKASRNLHILPLHIVYHVHNNVLKNKGSKCRTKGTSRGLSMSLNVTFFANTNGFWFDTFLCFGNRCLSVLP